MPDQVAKPLPPFDTHVMWVPGEARLSRLVTQHRTAFTAPQGAHTDVNPPATDVVVPARHARKDGMPAVFKEMIVDPRLPEKTADNTDTRIGGTVYSELLSPPDGPAGTYLEMARHSVRKRASATSS